MLEQATSDRAPHRQLEPPRDSRRAIDWTRLEEEYAATATDPAQDVPSNRPGLAAAIVGGLVVLVLVVAVLVRSDPSAVGAIRNVQPSGVVAPRGIAAAPDGSVWFAHASGVSRMAPSGEVTTYADPRMVQPEDVALGRDGSVWFTDPLAGAIGLLTPSGAVTMLPLPDGRRPASIAVAPSGAVWFTTAPADGTVGDGDVGRLAADGIEVLDQPWIVTPRHLAVGGDGQVWFTVAGGLGRVAADGAATMIPTPGFDTPDAVAVAPDGPVWFTDRASGAIVRMGTDGAATEMATTATGPAALAVDSGGDVWVVSEGTAIVTEVRPSGEVLYEAGAGVAMPYDVTAAPDGGVWFTNHGNASIGAAHDPTGG